MRTPTLTYTHGNMLVYYLRKWCNIQYLLSFVHVTIRLCTIARHISILNQWNKIIIYLNDSAVRSIEFKHFSLSVSVNLCSVKFSQIRRAAWYNNSSICFHRLAPQPITARNFWNRAAATSQIFLASWCGRKST